MKTYKREVAVIMLTLHWFLVMSICFMETGHDINSLVDLAIGLGVWVYGFAATAFGMDSWAKQVKRKES